MIALCQFEARGSFHFTVLSLANEDYAFCNRSDACGLPQAASHSFSAQSLRLDECSDKGSPRTSKTDTHWGRGSSDSSHTHPQPFLVTEGIRIGRDR